MLAASAAGRLLVVAQSVGSPDAILMLASHEWERLPAVARVARKYPSAVVLLTNPWRPDEWSCYRCPERPLLLQRAGVAADRIVILPQRATNTIGEARAAVEYVRRTPVRRLLVVTSPYHSRRALSVFRHVLASVVVEVGVEPALRESGATPGFWWAHEYDAWYVAYEWAALAKYALRHRVSPFVSSGS